MSAGSHAPSLLTWVKRTLRHSCQLEGGEAIAVAVSGGPDSMSLLHCLWLLRETYDFRLLALSVDHGLRKESRQEVELVRDFCATLAVAFAPIDLGLQAGANVHARARAARYEALWREADRHLGKESFLATAHHKNDRAETVLLRILRGTSLEGLGVLAPRQDRLLRPLIFASRRDVELHIERHELRSVNDPSNVDPRYGRSRVRAEVLPLLEELGPGVVDHLAALADEALQLPVPLGLTREHREQIRRALSEPSLPVDLRLPAGLRMTRDG